MLQRFLTWKGKRCGGCGGKNAKYVVDAALQPQLLPRKLRRCTEHAKVSDSPNGRNYTMHAVIVDGNPLAWRASKMFSEMRVPECKTGVIYGAINNLVRIVKATNPDSYVVVWDRGNSRWRRELSPTYKATRHAVKTPEEQAELDSIYDQINRTKELLDCAGVKQISVPYVEADDIIGILVSALDLSGNHDWLTIASGDRDLHQLIGGIVRVYSPIEGNWIGEASIRHKYDDLGYESLPQLKALTGDTTDEIEGATGIGIKSAIELLKKYGSLDKIFAPENAATFEKKARTRKLLAEEAKVRLALKLVTIPTVVRMEDLTVRERSMLANEIWKPVKPDLDKFAELIACYGFDRALIHKSWVKPAPNFEGVETWLASCS